MRIAVDAMGGDFSPQEAVQGAVLAVKEKKVHIILVGREEEIRKELSEAVFPEELISVVDAREKIEMHEHPATAVRKKKNASIVVANRLVKEGKADAVVSAGNTGAAMAASLLNLGRIPGIARPAIAIPMPTLNGTKVLLDAGANADCEPKDLLQFALMGSVYAETVLGLATPQVALLSIGEEETKGNRLVLETHRLLKESSLNFIGNIEGKDIPVGRYDVVVCDGFVGNTVLKLIEGVAGVLFKQIKDVLLSSPWTKIGAALIKPGLQSLYAKLDYSEYGGAPLLGVRGITIVSHGRSKAKAFKNAITYGMKAVEEDLIGKIRQSVEGNAAKKLKEKNKE